MEESHKLKGYKVDQKFAKLHINIPFTDVLEQMLSYVNFVKKIWANKKKLGEFETVALIEESSAIIQKKLLPKLTDPKSFNTPCYIGNGSFGKALCEHVHVCVFTL